MTLAVVDTLAVLSSAEIEGEKGNMAGPRKGSREKAFAKRLSQALDSHPRCPEEYGRLTWLKRELEHQKVSVSIETVRKWLTGEIMPRRDKMAALAKMLRIDETWLAMGAQPVEGVSPDRVAALEEALREIGGISRSAAIQQIIDRVLADED